MISLSISKHQTWSGGTGVDTIVAANALNNIINLGGGTTANTVTGGTGNNTITSTSTGATTITAGTMSGNNTVTLGNGTNAFTATNGNNTYTGGTGIDTVVVGTGANTINLGGGTTANSVTVGAAAGLNVITTTSTGVDTFGYTGIQTAGGYYASLTGWTKNDVINFTGAGTTASEATLGAKITLGGSSNFAEYLDAAVAGNATDALNWFQFNGNTYITVDNNTAATFTAGSDTVIELTGLVDLSAAVNASGVLTLA